MKFAAVNEYRAITQDNRDLAAVSERVEQTIRFSAREGKFHCSVFVPREVQTLIFEALQKSGFKVHLLGLEEVSINWLE